MTGMPSAFVRSQGFPEAGTVAECRLSALAAAAASRELQSWRDGAGADAMPRQLRNFAILSSNPCSAPARWGPFPFARFEPLHRTGYAPILERAGDGASHKSGRDTAARGRH